MFKEMSSQILSMRNNLLLLYLKKRLQTLETSWQLEMLYCKASTKFEINTSKGIASRKFSSAYKMRSFLKSPMEAGKLCNKLFSNPTT